MKGKYLETAQAVAGWWREHYEETLARQKEKAVAECNYNYMVYLAFYGELEAVCGHIPEAKRALLDIGAFRDPFLSACRKAFPEVRFPERDEDFPVLEPRFSVSHFLRAYQILKVAGALNEKEEDCIRECAVSGVNQAFTFLDWGTHNRGVMRAVNLMLAAQSFPDEKNAPLWRKTAENIMRDNQGAWSVEDTPNYFPIWLHDLFVYEELSDGAFQADRLKARYYLEMLVKLLNPLGQICDFGDDRPGVKAGQIACLERGAELFRSPEMKYAAARLFEGFRCGDPSKEETLRGIGTLLDACRWADDSVPEAAPPQESAEVLDDLVGKKLLFQNPGTYLLLNYRDEGDYGWLTRNFLRSTLTVQPEKMHHGHSDENSIVSLIHNGTLLLGDGGYRELENPNGEYRADYYHNGLIVRAGVMPEGAEPLSFALNRGDYERVRSEKIFFYRFEEIEISRTRVTKKLGVWDRVITWLKQEALFVVTDLFQPHADGDYTVFPLFYPETDQLLIEILGDGKKFQGEMTRRSQRMKAVGSVFSDHVQAGGAVVFHSVLSLGEPVCARVNGSALQIEGKKKYTIASRPVIDRKLRGVDKRPAYGFEEDKWQCGEFVTDAMYLCGCRQEHTLDYTLVNATRMDYRGRTVFGNLPVADFNEFNRVQGWPIRQDGAKTGIDTWWSCWNDTVEL